MSRLFAEMKAARRIEQPKTDASEPSSPPAPPVVTSPNPFSDLPPPAPCPACYSPVFWLDTYNILRCLECSPPPSPALARRYLLVVSLRTSEHNQPSKPELAWADFDDELRAAEARNEREAAREARNAKHRPTPTPAAGLPPQADATVLGSGPGADSSDPGVVGRIEPPTLDEAMQPGSGWTIDDWWSELGRAETRIVTSGQSIAEMLDMASICMNPEQLGWPVLSAAEKRRAELAGAERRVAIARGEILEPDAAKNKKSQPRRASTKKKNQLSE